VLWAELNVTRAPGAAAAFFFGMLLCCSVRSASCAHIRAASAWHSWASLVHTRAACASVTI